MSKNNITAAQLAGLTPEQILELINKPDTKTVTLKVSSKGGVSLYGMGRFPVTLYKSQWEKLIANVDHVKDFLKANESVLAIKEE